jgi:hypothetical protein
MMKSLYLITAAVLLTACSPMPPAPPATPVVPPTIGFESNNPIATENLRQALSRTGKASAVVNNQEHALSAGETQELLSLLAGAQSSTPFCAPADCFYLNLQAADGTWLMSLPVQKTPEGIVLLYLKLQGTNAGVPLQGWWKGVSSRLGI